MFEDIPLDLRHHPIKKHPKFPKEWYMTPERRKQLIDLRVDAHLKDREQREQGLLVDGKDVVQGYLGSPSAYEEEQYVPLMAKKFVRIRGGRMKSS
jgi:small subunit ribosomal protein S35